jgi:PAS domain S-box-containing protein
MEATEYSGPAGRPPDEAFRLFAESLGDLVWSARPNGRTDYCNRRFLDYLGRTAEQMEGWSWIEALHPDDVGPARQAWNEAQRQGTEYEAEFRLRRRDGRYCWHRSRARPVQDEHGRVVRWFGTCTDIDDRKQAEEALRQSEARYRDLFENANDAIYTLDLEGRITSVNRRAEQMFGYGRLELLGRSAAEFVPPEYLPRMQEALRRKLDDEETPTVYELEIIARDGLRIPLEVSSRLILRDGVPAGIQGIARDISERKRVEQTLREAHRRKDEFLAILAHELRNPLAPIRNAAEVLKMAGHDGPNTSRALGMIERQAAHMARLVDDLLDVSRIGRGKIHLRKERLDLTALVRLAVEDHRPLLASLPLEVRVDLPEHPLWVLGDATRLSQVVGNLLHNAGKFTDAGGQVFVRLAAEDNQAVLTIRDTGVGMEAGMLARLFEPFSQADRSLDRSRGGLGLGLALVKGLVELHGGNVAASSPGPGLGAAFAIRLPLVSAPVQAHSSPPSIGPAGRGLRILVIEDNLDAAESLRMLLELKGHEVDVVYAGQAGLDRARKVRPDLVLCDIGLPGGMDGYAVARALRGDEQLAGVVLIALTGYGQEEDRRRATEAGFDRHLTKPVDPADLTRFLDGLLVRQG